MIKRNMIKRWAPLAAVTAACLALASCANGGAPYPPPPPLQAEVIPKPPVTATPLMWQPGHWDWTGSGYTWVPGAYVPAAGHGAMWQQGYWAAAPDGSWVWQPAHWM
jgi:WXXGXW repeat (2 copies)